MALEKNSATLVKKMQKLEKFPSYLIGISVRSYSGNATAEIFSSSRVMNISSR